MIKFSGNSHDIQLLVNFLMRRDSQLAAEIIQAASLSYGSVIAIERLKVADATESQYVEFEISEAQLKLAAVHSGAVAFAAVSGGAYVLEPELPSGLLACFLLVQGNYVLAFRTNIKASRELGQETCLPLDETFCRGMGIRDSASCAGFFDFSQFTMLLGKAVKLRLYESNREVKLITTPLGMCVELGNELPKVDRLPTVRELVDWLFKQEVIAIRLRESLALTFLAASILVADIPDTLKLIYGTGIRDFMTNPKAEDRESKLKGLTKAVIPSIIVELDDDEFMIDSGYAGLGCR